MFSRRHISKSAITPTRDVHALSINTNRSSENRRAIVKLVERIIVRTYDYLFMKFLITYQAEHHSTQHKAL